MSLSRTTTRSRKSKSSTGTANNMLGRTGFELDELFTAEGQKRLLGEAPGMAWSESAGGLLMLPQQENSGNTCMAQYLSKFTVCKFPASEFLPSWNIRLHGPDQGFRLFMRVYGEGSHPSTWLLIGEGGNPPPDERIKTVSPSWGKTRIDYLDLKKLALAFQIRVDFFAENKQLLSEGKGPTLCRIFVHYSGPGIHRRVDDRATNLSSASYIKIPYRSQLVVEDAALRNHICCPTSLAMVLEHHGITKPTLDVCKEAYDARYDMYGVWPRVSHVAFQHGLVSWVHRFRSHADVRKYLKSGHPVIASIRVAEGELRGAQYGKSNGHIIVITGFHKDGRYTVNDPASPGPDGGEINYFAEDIEKVWLDKGGVAILIKPDTKK